MQLSGSRYVLALDSLSLEQGKKKKKKEKGGEKREGVRGRGGVGVRVNGWSFRGKGTLAASTGNQIVFFFNLFRLSLSLSLLSFFSPPPSSLHCCRAVLVTRTRRPAAVCPPPPSALPWRPLRPSVHRFHLSSTRVLLPFLLLLFLPLTGFNVSRVPL